MADCGLAQRGMTRAPACRIATSRRAAGWISLDLGRFGWRVSICGAFVGYIGQRELWTLLEGADLEFPVEPCTGS